MGCVVAVWTLLARCISITIGTIPLAKVRSCLRIRSQRFDRNLTCYPIVWLPNRLYESNSSQLISRECSSVQLSRLTVVAFVWVPRELLSSYVHMTPHGMLASLGCAHAKTYYVDPVQIITAACSHVVLRKYPMLKCEVITGPSSSCWFSSSSLSELVANRVGVRVCRLVATSYYLIPSAVSFPWWFISANLKSMILDICPTCVYKHLLSCAQN